MIPRLQNFLHIFLKFSHQISRSDNLRVSFSPIMSHKHLQVIIPLLIAEFLFSFSYFPLDDITFHLRDYTNSPQHLAQKSWYLEIMKTTQQEGCCTEGDSTAPKYPHSAWRRCRGGTTTPRDLTSHLAVLVRGNKALVLRPNLYLVNPPL